MCTGAHSCWNRKWSPNCYHKLQRAQLPTMSMYNGELPVAFTGYTWTPSFGGGPHTLGQVRPHSHQRWITADMSPLTPTGIRFDLLKQTDGDTFAIHPTDQMTVRWKRTDSLFPERTAGCVHVHSERPQSKCIGHTNYQLIELIH